MTWALTICKTKGVLGLESLRPIKSKFDQKSKVVANKGFTVSGCKTVRTIKLRKVSNSPKSKHCPLSKEVAIKTLVTGAGCSNK